MGFECAIGKKERFVMLTFDFDDNSVGIDGIAHLAIIYIEWAPGGPLPFLSFCIGFRVLCIGSRFLCIVWNIELVPVRLITRPTMEYFARPFDRVTLLPKELRYRDGVRQLVAKPLVVTVNT